MGVIKFPSFLSSLENITLSLYELLHMQWRIFWYHYINVRHFTVFAIDFFSKVDRGSKMTINGLYGNLGAEFMETKHSGYIHRYGTHIFDNIVVYISKTINVLLFLQRKQKKIIIFVHSLPY